MHPAAVAARPSTASASTPNMKPRGGRTAAHARGVGAALTRTSSSATQRTLLPIRSVYHVELLASLSRLSGSPSMMSASTPNLLPRPRSAVPSRKPPSPALRPFGRPMASPLAAGYEGGSRPMLTPGSRFGSSPATRAPPLPPGTLSRQTSSGRFGARGSASTSRPPMDIDAAGNSSSSAAAAGAPSTSGSFKVDSGHPLGSVMVAPPAGAPIPDFDPSKTYEELLEEAEKDTEYGRLSAKQKARQAFSTELGFDAESYVELNFEMDANGTQVDEKARVAAEVFDKGYVRLAGDARQKLIETALAPHDPMHRRRADVRVTDVFRHRYALPETADRTAPIAGAPRPRKKATRVQWRLAESIWNGRLKTFGDLFETAGKMRNLFDNDWAVAVRSHELSFYIVKSHRDPSTWRDIDKNGMHDEVDEVAEALFQHHRLLYGAYDHYAAKYSENETAPGEPDVWNVSFTAYMYMNCVEECKMLSRSTPHSEFEMIWSIVNAVDRGTAQDDLFNAGRFLNRQEFVQCLVRMAIAVYVQRGAIGDVSDAVNRLMASNLGQFLPKEATQNSNAFRKRFCYIERTSKVLEHYAPSLRALYDAYSDSSHDLRDTLRDAEAMSIGEWVLFLQHTGVTESGLISTQTAKNIFMWSRLRTLAKRTHRAEQQLRHMLFLDFLEGIVRIALMCPLPTSTDLDETGAADAGEFLLAMRANEPTAYATFLTTHRPKFSDPDGSDYEDHAMQPVWNCVEHLAKLLIRTVEHLTSARADASKADGKVSLEEAQKFLKKRAEGTPLEHASAHAAQSLGRIQFGEALESSKLKILTTAAAIRIQMASRARKARQRVEERKQRVAEHKERGAEYHAAHGG